MPGRLIQAASLELRVAAAEDWLSRHPAGVQLLLVADNAGSANELLRRVAVIRGAVFGWHRMTLGRLAGALAAPLLARHRRSAVGGLAAQAMAARVVHELGRGGTGRFDSVARRPGFAVALARTLIELRMAGVDAGQVEQVDPDLARLQRHYERELELAGLADRASVYRLAREALQGERQIDVVGLPLLLLDLSLDSAAERELLAELARRAPDVLATVPAGDSWSTSQLGRVLQVEAEVFDAPDAQGALARLQTHLFSEEVPAGAPEDDGVSIFSAPGESRECVEVARRVLQEAEEGVPFDRMAILIHSIDDHRRHVEEALARADIPAYFAQGAMAPDPGGRAFVALLSCAAEDLSARRFAEYLSVGEVPPAEVDGAPPPTLPSTERWVPPDEELLPEFLAQIALSAQLAAREQQALDEEAEAQYGEPDETAVRGGTLRTPRRWERLINDAAVIGGHDRWRRRLEGMVRELEYRLEGMEEPDEPAGDGIRRQIAEIRGLQAFALPMLELLHSLPREATWGEWIERLSDLATRALRRPGRVLSVLAELSPMAPIGPVGLAQVRLVLTPRLTEMMVPAKERRYGAVFVGRPEAVRGLPAFEVVFVPGLAEKLFPRRILEDPILPDEQRTRLSPELARNDQRVERERLALRLAVGAARRRLYLSYSRLDLHHARPRVPSFYTLEVMRAVRGRLPGFGELARMAEVAGAARLSWPAPPRPRQAIDEGEHDLALLERLLRLRIAEPADAGILAQLLTTNPHMGRAVRHRAQRWGRKWSVADGLVRPSPAGREALLGEMLSVRSYSPTALQTYAACPYRFLLYAIQRLTPWEAPSAIDELDPLQRGALVHEVQFLLLSSLADAGHLPLTMERLELANEALDRVVAEVTQRYRDEFAPAIERVWQDGVASVRADLREWLRREAKQPSGWTPWRFEYSFGLSPRVGEHRDRHSTDEPVQLACGIRLRGKIDLVERDPSGRLRVTDHKTGKAWVKPGAVIEGGQMLQPLLYALAAREQFGVEIDHGRLYYCTVAGGYAERVVALNEQTEQAAAVVAQTIQLALERGFLPAAPAAGACQYCDYIRVCGRREEQRVQLKGQKALRELLELRDMP